MAWTWDEIMALMNTYHALTRQEYYDAETATANAWTGYGIPDDHVAIFWICTALDEIVSFMLHSMYNYPFGLNGFDSMTEALFKLTNTRIEGISTELTMDGLLSTMLSADPTQVEYFVGLVDAYRQSIWNRPFNKEFFTALGRGFMEWP